MPEANGHAPDALLPIEPETATAAEFDALLSGVFEPRQFEYAPGRFVEIRPMVVGSADAFYEGKSSGALQRYVLGRCVFVNGRPIGEANAARMPLAMSARVFPVAMALNNMEIDKPDDRDGEVAELPDPKA